MGGVRISESFQNKMYIAVFARIIGGGSEFLNPFRIR